METKRILCVGSYRLPSNAWLRVLAFKRIGMTVESVDNYTRRKWIRRLPAPLRRKIARWTLNPRIRSAVARHRPEVVFFEKNLWMTLADLASLRQFGRPGMRLVHYNPDDPFGEYSRMWRGFVRTISAYDVHFVPRLENISEYSERGARHVAAFDRSFDPIQHRPVQLTREERAKFGCPVGFIGTWAHHREEMIARLIRDGIPVAVWGTNWQRGSFWNVIKPYWRGPSQVGEDYTKAICGMDIALHFLRRENRDLQDSRTFEIPACGTFMLAERTSDHERLFAEGSEAVFFDSYEDLLAKVKFYLNNPRQRQKVAAAGRLRCLNSGYDHDSRLRQFLQQIHSACQT